MDFFEIAKGIAEDYNKELLYDSQLKAIQKLDPAMNNKITGKYIIRDREAGNVIEEASSYYEATEIIDRYESEDKEEGIYTIDFYEIIKREDLWEN